MVHDDLAVLHGKQPSLKLEALLLVQLEGGEGIRGLNGVRFLLLAVRVEHRYLLGQGDGYLTQLLEHDLSLHSRLVIHLCLLTLLLILRLFLHRVHLRKHSLGMYIWAHLRQQDYLLNRHVLGRFCDLSVGGVVVVVVLARATLPVEGAVAGFHRLDIWLLDATLGQELGHIDRLLDLKRLNIDSADTRVVEDHDFWFGGKREVIVAWACFEVQAAEWLDLFEYLTLQVIVDQVALLLRHRHHDTIRAVQRHDLLNDGVGRHPSVVLEVELRDMNQSQRILSISGKTLHQEFLPISEQPKHAVGAEIDQLQVTVGL